MATAHNIEFFRQNNITIWIEKMLVEGCLDMLRTGRCGIVGWRWYRTGKGEIV